LRKILKPVKTYKNPIHPPLGFLPQFKYFAARYQQIVSNLMVSRGMGRKRRRGLDIEDLMARTQCKPCNDCKL